MTEITIKLTFDKQTLNNLRAALICKGLAVPCFTYEILDEFVAKLLEKIKEGATDWHVVKS